MNEPGVGLGNIVGMINMHKMLLAEHEWKRQLRVMITRDRVKPRMVLRKQNVFGFYKHDH